MNIDSHQHFWNPARGDLDWIPAGDPILDRVYGPQDLVGHLVNNSIDGTVLVQAAPTIHETEYLLGLADASDFVKGVVGWVDFETPEDLRQLERLARHPKFKGLRPMIQDQPDPDWMLRPDLAWAYAALADLGLTLDILARPHHMANVLTLLQRHPNLRVVLDHALKPDITNPQSFDAWAQGMSRLAQETTAHVKLSGLVTEAAPGWSAHDLHPHVDHLIQAFGPQRIMWGSDWPVVRLRCEYGAWLHAARHLTARLPLADQGRIYGGTAVEFYNL